jgi:AcrR family transcriptional regulator
VGRRSDHSHEELRELILSATEAIIAEAGIGGLTARRVAERIGYSVGTLYNFFDDLDDLVIHVKGRTLDGLLADCARVVRRTTPEAALRAYARAYLRFTNQHQSLWAVVLDGSAQHHGELPDWYHTKVDGLLRLVEEALVPLIADAKGRRRSARVLWASLHGISSVSGTGAAAESAPVLVKDLITHYVAGLETRG